MGGTVELPQWVVVLGTAFAAVAPIDRVVGPSLRWFFRQRVTRAIDEINARLQLKIQPFKLTERRAPIDRLAHDAQVRAAVEAHMRESGEPRAVVMARVEQIAREIVPSFSAITYFAVGARLARLIAQSLYRVRLGAFDEAALARVDREAAVVFVINHRSNADYLLVTYLAATRSALSDAVGEWARIWPLSRIIRAMGAYFIRRRSRDALYRRVLARYVRMATDGGVTQAIFPEGGLSRGSRLARLHAAGAHAHIPRASFDYAVEVGMRMLTLRGIATETEGVYAAAPEETGLLRFYANSIAHLLPEEPV